MVLEGECPACHRVNRPRARECEGCGFNFVTNRPGQSRRRPSAGSRPGVFGLALGTIVHPVATMDSFFYYVSDIAMLGRMVIFYLVSLPIAGWINTAGTVNVSWIQGTLAEAAGFAVSTICIVGIGRFIGQGGNLLGAAAILGFVRAVVTFVGVLYALAIVTGILGPSFLVILVFMIWSVVLNIVALANIFGCSAGIAFLISILAGFLHTVITRAIGVPT